MFHGGEKDLSVHVEGLFSFDKSVNRRGLYAHLYALFDWKKKVHVYDGLHESVFLKL